MSTPVVASRRWRAVLASVALAVLGYLAFSLWGGWHEVVAAGAHVGWTGAAVMLGLSALNYALRFVRWQLFLRQLGHPMPWRRSAAIYLAGFALTTTPGKAGEAVRSVFLRGHGMGYTESMAAFLSERLSDLVAVVALAALGWASFPSLRPLIAVGLLAVLALLLLLAQERLMAAGLRRTEGQAGRLPRLLHQVLRMLQGARRCHQWPLLLQATVLSLLAWSAEALAMHCMLGWLAVSADWHFSFFVYAAGMLAGALSFLPGGLGGAEAVMVWLLLWRGVTQPVAVAATVLIRLTTLWFAVVLGVFALTALLRETPAVPADAGSGA